MDVALPGVHHAAGEQPDVGARSAAGVGRRSGQPGQAEPRGARGGPAARRPAPSSRPAASRWWPSAPVAEPLPPRRELRALRPRDSRVPSISRPNGTADGQAVSQPAALHARVHEADELVVGRAPVATGRRAWPRCGPAARPTPRPSPGTSGSAAGTGRSRRSSPARRRSTCRCMTAANVPAAADQQWRRSEFGVGLSTWAVSTHVDAPRNPLKMAVAGILGATEHDNGSLDLGRGQQARACIPDEIENFLRTTSFSGYQSVPLPHGLSVPGDESGRPASRPCQTRDRDARCLTWHL